MDVKRKQNVSAILIITAAIIGAYLRFANLGAMPVHYDEGAYALVTSDFVAAGEYTYLGQFHGPPLYYLSAILFSVFGESVLIGRALVAAVSLGVFPALYALREEISPTVSILTAFVLAVHPYVLYPSRFFRHDALVVTALLWTLVFYTRYRKRPSRYTGIALGVGLGLTIAPKEVGYLLLAAISVPVALFVHFKGQFADSSIRESLNEYLPTETTPWIVAGIAGTMVLLFGGWPPDPLSAPVAIFDGLVLWFTRSSSSAPDPLYYLGPLITEQTGLFALACLGCLGTVLRSDTSIVRWMFVSWIVLIGLLLSFHSHQRQWSFLYIITPAAFLASFGITDVYVAATRYWSFTSRFQEWFPTDADRLIVVGLVALTITAPMGASHVVGSESTAVGLTYTPTQDLRQDTLSFAAAQSERTDCQVLLGATNNPHPHRWFLRDTNFTSRNAVPNLTKGIHVLKDDRDVQMDESYTARTFTNEAWPFGWHVYTPESGCGDS